MFYQGNDIADLLSWGGVLFTSVVAFILPLSLALYMLLQYDVEGSIKVGFSQAPWARKWSLIVLLCSAIFAVTVAIWGLTEPPPPVQFTDPVTGGATLIPPPALNL
jgi:putative copper export protein